MVNLERKQKVKSDFLMIGLLECSRWWMTLDTSAQRATNSPDPNFWQMISDAVDDSCVHAKDLCSEVERQEMG